MAPPGQQKGNEFVPASMVQQAAAAAASENDDNSNTSTQRRHMGRDVPAPHEQPGLDNDDYENDIPPPAYGEHYGSIQNEQDGFGTDATVGDDGRVNIRINQRNRKLSSMLVPALRQQQELAGKELEPPPPYVPPSLGGEEGVPPPPPMNVVIQVVGSRGDVQPFVALGKVLKDTYGHRVRLATHPVFKDFVGENGLEFFSIGGDPAQLMAFMVKNPGLMPGFDTLRSGDIGKRRKEVGEYIKGCWRSCFEAGDGLGAEATDQTIEDWATQHPTSGDDSSKPFVADCIIANPPSFAHVHCAEKLGIPLHMMFTMPYSPTQAFPHPLANIQSSNADKAITNYISYALIDMLTWQGLGDVINRFRQKSLGLDPISLVWAPGMLQRMKVPHTYCWSPALIPKPKDWGQHISISGFYFLNLASNFTPAPDLQAFLDAGPPPVYIGFGSIVLDDPNGMTKLIFEAVQKTGQRALVSKGWGGVGADELGIPEGVFMLGNVPHDWLFKHVSCVVHHGGAGTTAAGITAGRPTLVVPFFGDQQFWGQMVSRAGAGPEPIPHKQLTADNLANGIQACLRNESQERAQELADKIASERGSDVGAQSFHQMLDVDGLRCNVAPSRAAVWRLKRTNVRLSAMAACTLANEGLLDFNELKLFRAREYETDDGPWDPITGGATALVGTISTMMMGVADFPIDTLKALKIHPDSVKSAKVSDERSETTDEEVGQGIDEKGSKKPVRASSSSELAISSGASTPATSRSNSTFNLQESLARIQTPTSPLAKDGSKSPTRGSIPQSMADALRGQLEGVRQQSRSGSRPRSPGGGASGSGGSGSGENPINTAIDTGKGLRRIIGAGFSSPMDFTMGLAKGFHNAPKLYGDETVRKSEPVTDFRSGVKAATKEFGYGMYDGITGLVTQPMRGAVKEGPAGFVKGIGKGIGGITLKPGAAIFGIPGYTMKGVYKEIQKRFGSGVQNYIIAARTAQGFDEWQAADEGERRDVVVRWKMLQAGLKKKRNPDEIVKDAFGQGRKKVEANRYWKTGKVGNERAPGSAGDASRAQQPMSGNVSRSVESTAHAPEPLEDDGTELEEAIRQSVQQTSRGNAEEDSEIERAIQASMAELQLKRESRPPEDEEAEHLRQAMAASQSHGEANPAHDEELERVLAQSLREQHRQRSSDSEWDSDPDTEDDEDYRRAIQDSQHGGPPPAYDPGHVGGATREEFEQLRGSRGGAGGAEKSQQERTEEEVVMEYVKKQSLLEAEHRRGGGGKGKAPRVTDEGEEEEEELRRAMKMSLQDHGHDRRGEGSGA